MQSDFPIKGMIVRPGAARSRLEALAYAGLRPCPSCGARIGPSVSRAADPADGAVWEVRADCYSCARVVRYLFEAGPGWPEDDERADGTVDPDTFADRFGPPGTQTALFSAADLAQLRDEAAGTLASREAEQAETPGDAMLPRLVAEAAAAVLRPMVELELLAAGGAAVLPADHSARRAHMISALRAIGRGPSA
jgi:hypothetical protein